MKGRRRQGLKLPGALPEGSMTVVPRTMRLAPFDDPVTVLLDRWVGAELAAEAARGTRRAGESLDVQVDERRAAG